MNETEPTVATTTSRRWPVVTMWVATALAAACVVLGLDRLTGATVRQAGLILPATNAPPSAPSYTDLPRGGLFFEQRDSITVDLPRSMSVAEFLSLYHLENHVVVRRALEQQLGALNLDDMLEEGERVTFRLTRGRESVAPAPGGGP